MHARFREADAHHPPTSGGSYSSGQHDRHRASPRLALPCRWSDCGPGGPSQEGGGSRQTPQLRTVCATSRARQRPTPTRPHSTQTAALATTASSGDAGIPGRRSAFDGTRGIGEWRAGWRWYRARPRPRPAMRPHVFRAPRHPAHRARPARRGFVGHGRTADAQRFRARPECVCTIGFTARDIS